MKRQSRTDKLAEAAMLERYAAEALVRASGLRREAEAMKDEPRELAAWWFAWVRQVRRAH